MAVGMLPVNQYSMTLVNSSSLVNRASTHENDLLQLHPDQAKNFSIIYAANPMGESFKATPMLSGLVAKVKK